MEKYASKQSVQFSVRKRLKYFGNTWVGNKTEVGVEKDTFKKIFWRFKFIPKSLKTLFMQPSFCVSSFSYISLILEYLGL